MSNYNTNSLEAYLKADVSTGKTKVVKAIKNGANTQEEISLYTGMQRATVSGRVNDLLRENIIYVTGKTKNRKGLTIDQYDLSWEGAPEYQPKPTYKEFILFVKELINNNESIPIFESKKMVTEIDTYLNAE